MTSQGVPVSDDVRDGVDHDEVCHDDFQRGVVHDGHRGEVRGGIPHEVDHGEVDHGEVVRGGEVAHGGKASHGGGDLDSVRDDRGDAPW